MSLQSRPRVSGTGYARRLTGTPKTNGDELLTGGGSHVPTAGADDAVSAPRSPQIDYKHGNTSN